MVFRNNETSKNSKNLQNSWNWRRESSYLLNDLRNFNEIFEKKNWIKLSKHVCLCMFVCMSVFVYFHRKGLYYLIHILVNSSKSCVEEIIDFVSVKFPRLFFFNLLHLSNKDKIPIHSEGGKNILLYITSWYNKWIDIKMKAISPITTDNWQMKERYKRLEVYSNKFFPFQSQPWYWQ